MSPMNEINNVFPALIVGRLVSVEMKPSVNTESSVNSQTDVYVFEKTVQKVQTSRARRK